MFLLFFNRFLTTLIVFLEGVFLLFLNSCWFPKAYSSKEINIIAHSWSVASACFSCWFVLIKDWVFEGHSFTFILWILQCKLVRVFFNCGGGLVFFEKKAYLELTVYKVDFLQTWPSPEELYYLALLLWQYSFCQVKTFHGCSRNGSLKHLILLIRGVLARQLPKQGRDYALCWHGYLLCIILGNVYIEHMYLITLITL